ncbi:hypothetical protein K402DRAFT_399413 [Aulographum hederae CBS 113979]|uniref:Uncharacterized protein n=1 Tax=Aulographum hederae CBS 113979 TaxID=1176131 RepID=A0A6G1HH60_9PEZI|nr:hypothetical protein K402DRAFT_399413 [Aulographum hederae CBS 113979]
MESTSAACREGSLNSQQQPASPCGIQPAGPAHPDDDTTIWSGEDAGGERPQLADTTAERHGWQRKKVHTNGHAMSLGAQWGRSRIHKSSFKAAVAVQMHSPTALVARGVEDSMLGAAHTLYCTVFAVLPQHLAVAMPVDLGFWDQRVPCNPMPLVARLAGERWRRSSPVNSRRVNESSRLSTVRSGVGTQEKCGSATEPSGPAASAIDDGPGGSGACMSGCRLAEAL